MKSPFTTFAVLPSDVEADVAGLAIAHAAFDPDRRRVVKLDRCARTPESVVALTIRDDGTLCAVLTRSQALHEAWIEDSFVRAARKPLSFD